MGKIVEKPSLKERVQEFNDFRPIQQFSSKAMSETQCTDSKACEKASGDRPELYLEKREVSNSKTSVSACSCGPECGPDKCEGRNRSILVGWDSLRKKIFLIIFLAFLLWLVIYVPISLTILGN